MLLTEYAIKRCIVIPPTLTNVSTLPGKHEPWKLCLFSHAVYRVSKMTLQLLLQKFPEHAVDFAFSDEQVFIVASPVNLHNDHVYVPSNAKLCDIAPERLLRCQPMFSSSLMMSTAVLKRGYSRCIELFFVDSG